MRKVKLAVMLILLLVIVSAGEVRKVSRNWSYISNGITYQDLDGDGVKDVIVSAFYSPTLGGSKRYSYSFYLKRGKFLQYIPIESEKYGADAVIYSLHHAGACNEKGKWGEETAVSEVILLRENENLYLIKIEKNCPEEANEYFDYCPLRVRIWKLEKEEYGFAFQGKTDIKSKYCDVRDFIETADIVKLVRGKLFKK